MMPVSVMHEQMHQRAGEDWEPDKQSEHVRSMLSEQQGTCDDKKSDQFIKFEIPIDPNQPDGLKTIIQFRKLQSDELEDVLVHLRNVNKLVDDLETDECEAFILSRAIARQLVRAS